MKVSGVVVDRTKPCRMCKVVVSWGWAWFKGAVVEMRRKEKRFEQGRIGI